MQYFLCLVLSCTTWLRKILCLTFFFYHFWIFTEEERYPGSHWNWKSKFGEAKDSKSQRCWCKLTSFFLDNYLLIWGHCDWNKVINAITYDRNRISGQVLVRTLDRSPFMRGPQKYEDKIVNLCRICIRSVFYTGVISKKRSLFFSALGGGQCLWLIHLQPSHFFFFSSLALHLVDFNYSV